ncbi:MAG: hypothetical protein C5B49_13580 [Bdellovibrio sp.]|nr:MAG: hypothetical protein C5B49_13580 [Bdellovibrio sp.]
MFVINGGFMKKLLIVSAAVLSLHPLQTFAQARRSYSSLSDPTPAAGRDYTVALKGNISSMSQSGTSTTTFNLDSQFGWNQGSWEAGPRFTYLNQTSQNVSTNTTLIGGYGDYNFVQSGDHAAGITGSLMLGNISAGANFNLNSGTIRTGESTSYNSVAIGGVFKWFVLRNAPTAIRFELLYQTANYSGTTSSGLNFTYGLQVYF